MVEELEGTDHVVLIDPLGNPGLAEGDGETEEYCVMSDTLANDGEGVTEVLKDVVSGCQSDLPLVEGTGRRFLEAEMPASDLAFEARATGMLILADEEDLNRKVAREFPSSEGDPVDGLMFGDMHVGANVGSCDVCSGR
jgi:hypothetical protein